MPFILKHKETSQVATDMLINAYDLPYYGTKYWESEAEANEAFEAYLIDRSEHEPSNWQIVEIDEMQMKLFNVKLKNDASLRLFVDDQGKPFVKSIK